MSKIRTLLGIIRSKVLKLSKKIEIGKNPRIDLSVVIFCDKKSNITIGDSFETRRNCELRAFSGGQISIGNKVFINNNVNIVSNQKIVIADNVQIGHNTLIIDHDHDYKKRFDNFISKEINIESNVWIGANCTILKGVKIGKNAIIAAGSIVTKNIPNNTIFYNEKNPIYNTYIKGME